MDSNFSPNLGSSYSQIDFAHHYPPTPRISPGPPLRGLESPRPQPTVKPRNITPPDDNSVHDKALDDVNAQFVYEQNLAMIKQLEKDRPERPVSTTISSRNFQRLMNDLDYYETDKKWPRYSYDASTSKMIIQCMPSPLHQCISEEFLTAIHRTTADLPLSVESTIITTSNEDFNEFSGQYQGSRKIPDAAVLLDVDGIMRIKIAMEVGFTENYQDLVQDIRKWLEGAGAAVAILVKIKEAPVYRDPSRHFSDQEKAEFFSQPLSENAQDFNVDGEFGPATYKGLQWTGVIASADLEVWRRDPGTGLARKDRRNTDLLAPHVQFGIKLSEFMSIDPQHDRTISLKTERLRVQLKRAILRLMRHRYLGARNAYLKLADNMRDQDYQPGPAS